MGDVKPALMDLSDEVWARTRARLGDLTDDEYLWEPAPGCWSIRQRADGRWTCDRTVRHAQRELAEAVLAGATST